MRRGALVPIVQPEAYGKPRPALVIQSDLFNVHPSVTILPLTSELRDTPLFRLRVEPSAKNGLHVTSEVMVDKIIDKFQPPKELLIKLVGLRYDNISKFWSYLFINDKYIENLILKHPFSTENRSFIHNYKKIVRIINEYLMDEHLFEDYNLKKLI